MSKHPNRITRGVLFALFLAWAAPVHASQVTRFEVEFFESGSSDAMNTATVWISDRRIRIEQRESRGEQDGPVLIYRGDLGRFFSVHPRAEKYSEFEHQQISKLALEVRRARLEVARQLNKMPTDQRKAFESLLGMTPSRPDAVHSPTTVTSDNVRESVAGFECTRASMKRAGVLVGEICVAPWESLGITRSDIEVFRELANFKREMIDAMGPTPLELVPDQPLDLLVQFDGFPLYFRRAPANPSSSAILVKRVETLASDDSLFEVPENFARRLGHRDFLVHLGLGQNSTSPASPESMDQL